MEKLKKFNTKEEYQEWKDSDDYSYPNVCKVADEIVYNDYPDYFWIEALEDVEVRLTNSIATMYYGSYSFDHINWMNSTTPIIVRTGNKVYVKSTDGEGEPCYVKVSGKHNIGGSIISLTWGDDYLNRKYFNSKYAESQLFKSCENIINAKDLVLGEEFSPNSSAAYSPLKHLFEGAVNMITAPKLIKAPLLSGCYYGTFKNCASLKKSPTIYGDYSGSGYHYDCSEMFKGCSNLSYIKYMGVSAFTKEGGQSYQGWSYKWVSGVSPTGTFIANSKRTDFTRGYSGIPEGWDIYLYDVDNDRYVVKFKVNGIPYEYYTDEPKDITWNEFINSEYNTNGFTAQQEDGETAKTIKFGDNYVLLSDNKVLITDKVILNTSYTIGQPTTTTELTETTNEEE